LSGAPSRSRIFRGSLSRTLTRILGADAVTLGHRIFLSRAASSEIERRTLSGARLLAHELAHVDQYARDGVIRFLLRYAVAYARGRRSGLAHRDAYAAIPYELEATRAEGARPGSPDS
jgi:hypothetical protein